MSQDAEKGAEILRQINELRVLVSSARRRYQTGERLNLLELQNRADDLYRLSQSTGRADAATLSSLLNALQQTVSELDDLSTLVSADYESLSRKIAEAEKNTNPKNPSNSTTSTGQ